MRRFRHQFCRDRRGNCALVTASDSDAHKPIQIELCSQVRLKNTLEVTLSDNFKEIANELSNLRVVG